MIECQKWNVAPEGNNLKHNECDLLLLELVTRTEILKTEPDVIHRLEAMAQDDGDLNDHPLDSAATPHRPALGSPRHEVRW